MKKKILAIGEIIWDVYSAKTVIGGAPLNFASHLSLCGADSTLISAVGEDELGALAISKLKKFKINTKYVKKVAQSTGQCIVTLNEESIPTYNVLKNAAYDNIKLEKEDLENIILEKYNAFYFGTLIQRNYISRLTVQQLLKKCKFENIVCDINLRSGCYDKESINLCLTKATILKVSMEEEPIMRQFGLYEVKDEIPESIAKSISKVFKQLEVIIITLGKDGSYAYVVEENKGYCQEAVGEKVVSTVGAGDSFTAAWLTGYLNGASMSECLKKAAEISGFVVSHTEAVPMYNLGNH